MVNYTKASGRSLKSTPQTEPIFGSNQEKNNAGGYSFVLDTFGFLRRFLILGTEGGTYYSSEQKLAKDNAKNAIKAISEDGVRAVKMAVEVSYEGLAKSNDPAIFLLALAFAYGNAETKKEAELAFPKVCRIGTHVLHFVSFVNDITGWTRKLRRTVSNWYTSKEGENLEYQLVKYQNRDGWTNHDVMHMAHPKPLTPHQENLFYWAKEGKVKEGLPVGKFLTGYMICHQDPTNITQIVKTITEHGLTFEMLPTQCLKEKRVWEALLPHMGYGALVRNLGRLSSIGLVEPFGQTRNKVVERLLDKDEIQRSRIHPLSILNAIAVYNSGHGVKGNLYWKADQKVSDALNEAFYASFKNVQKTGVKQMICLDVSGSMSSKVAGGVMSCRMATAAMAMITARLEDDFEIFGFRKQLVAIPIAAHDSLDTVMKKVSAQDFGVTNCSAPMEWAIKNKVEGIVGFSVYTDNETFAGRRHPSQDLKDYRKRFSPQAKLAVVGMTATKFSIADPADVGMLDFVGFDSSAPQIMANFFAGKI